jgi:hypothetical protein
LRASEELSRYLLTGSRVTYLKDFALRRELEGTLIIQDHIGKLFPGSATQLLRSH